MQMSFAPMEGITSACFRRIHAACFPGADRYYAPFLAPDGSGKVKNAALRELYPENNVGIDLVPQILCNGAEAFLGLAKELQAMGYGEVNLNVGCPSATVVPKHKGAGMLLDLHSLDGFFDRVFSACPLRISVKTRLGLESAAEFPVILELYNKYPLSELIIHARDRKGLYQSTPDLGAFAAAYPQSRAPVCYNGNVLDCSGFETVLAAVPGLERVMCGRGAAANPALFRVLRGGKTPELGELRFFLDRLCAAYEEDGLPPYYLLGRMKELWYYVNHMFPGTQRELKQLNKARSLSDYHTAVEAIFASGRFDPGAAFPGIAPKTANKA